MHDITIRPVAARDSFAAITLMLHRAYAGLAAQGLNLTSAEQDEALTRQRAALGQCFVAEVQGTVVGTVTVAGPHGATMAPWDADAPWFRAHDTAHLFQFGLDPTWTGRGVGRGLFRACEDWALAQGYAHLALDAAEPAAQLRSFYQHQGFVNVGHVQWQGKNFLSIVMKKALLHAPLRHYLQTLARYNRWATRQLLAHVDALPDEAYRRDIGLFYKSVHGTLNHLLVAEQQLWFRRFQHGESPRVVLDAEVETDRRTLRKCLMEGAQAWVDALDRWPEERLWGQIRYQRINGAWVTLPFGATLGHVFNHGTHHRGQITAALTAFGQTSPQIDLVYMLHEEAAYALAHSEADTEADTDADTPTDACRERA